MRRKITDKIREWASSGRRTALLIRGARQTGKTYSVNEFGKGYEHYLKIDFSVDNESRSAFDSGLSVDEIVLRLSAIHLGFEFVPGKTLIFLDEIQECPEARTSLKQFAIDGRYRVIASGSLLGLKMREVTLPPTGYVDYIDLGPMDFEEFLWALGLPQPPIDEVRRSIRSSEPVDESLYAVFSRYYLRYIAVGGMPAAVREFVERKQLAPVTRVQRNILDSYIDDIRKHADPSIRARTESCFKAIPSMLANESKRFVYDDVVTEDPERGYRLGFRYYEPAMDWLSMANISITCKRISEPHIPLEESVSDNLFKLYMIDTGLLASLYDPSTFSEILKGNTDVNMGAIAENAVAVAFSLQGRIPFYYSSIEPRREVDFVTPVGGKACAVEVKSRENRRCRSLNDVMNRYGIGGIMFETRNIFIDDKGVRHYPLFAASFMDSIDPVSSPTEDFSDLEEIGREYS